jgi:DNA-binding transcriptional MerR regulator
MGSDLIFNLTLTLSSSMLRYMKDVYYTATELGERLGVSARTLRFYESKELINPSRVGNRRIYNYQDNARMKLILRGKRIGFSLEEIKSFLDLYDHDADQSTQVQLLFNKVSERIEQLRIQKHDIETTLNELKDIQSAASSTLKNKPKIRWSQS